MKATDLLRQQHDEMKDLLQQLGQVESTDRGAIRQAFATMLRAHNQTEEELFYPRFEGESDITERLEESSREHDQALIALGELERCSVDAFDFKDFVDSLEQHLLEHVDIEESEVIPKAESLWTEGMLNELGNAIKQRFDELCESAGFEERV